MAKITLFAISTSFACPHSERGGRPRHTPIYELNIGIKNVKVLSREYDSVRQPLCQFQTSFAS